MIVVDMTVIEQWPDKYLIRRYALLEPGIDIDYLRERNQLVADLEEHSGQDIFRFVLEADVNLRRQSNIQGFQDFDTFEILTDFSMRPQKRRRR